MANEEENVDVDGLSGSDYESEDIDDIYEDDEGNLDDATSDGHMPKRKHAHHNALERLRRNQLTTTFDDLLLTIKRDSSNRVSRDSILEITRTKLKEMSAMLPMMATHKNRLEQIQKEIEVYNAKRVSGEISETDTSSMPSSQPRGRGSNSRKRQKTKAD